MDAVSTVQADMKRLWAETFGDSREYIDLVFGAYCSPDTAFCIYDGNILASALLSVPYTFRYTAADGAETLLKTRYLCGLATRPEYRGRGLIGRLMDDARNAARADGCAFMTLIPASASLRRFYAIKGWKDKLPRCEALIGAQTRFESVYGISEYRFIDVREWLAGGAGKMGDSVRLTELYGFFSRARKADQRPNLTIQHSLADFRTILAENVLSGGSVIVGFDGADRIVGLAFMVSPDEIMSADGRVERTTRIPYLRMADASVLHEFLKFAYLRTNTQLLVNTPFSAVERSMLESLGFPTSLKPYGMLLPLSASSSSTSPESTRASSPSAAFLAPSEFSEFSEPTASFASSPASLETLETLETSAASFYLMLD